MVKCSTNQLWLLGAVAICLLIFTVVLVGRQASFSPSASETKVQTKNVETSPKSKEAYVTLLYSGGPFLLGARILGQSLRETGTKNDLVALCTDGVPEDARRLLIADGWRIRSVTNIHNPYEGKSSKGNYFSGIYSKLYIWNMTEYERVMFLDSDTIVLANVDRVFDCGTLCLVHRHSDLFNSGVLVVEPSTKVFNDLIENIPLIPSYENGEQGFLNVYFRDIRSARMFNWSDGKRYHEHMRLQAGLNADTAMYYLKSEWRIPDDELKVIHYTIGPVSKPWVWWTPYLLDLNWYYNKVRTRLPRHKEFEDHYVVLRWIVLSLPYPFMAAFFALLCHLDCSSFFIDRKYPAAALKLFAFVNERLYHIFPLVFLVSSYYITYQYVVPTTMYTHPGEYVFWLWSNSILITLFGIYCYLCHLANNYNQQGVSQKKRQTLMMYGAFLVSYMLLQAIPQIIKHFSNRIVAFFVLLALHLVVCHSVGQWVIQVWTGSDKLAAVRPASGQPQV